MVNTASHEQMNNARKIVSSFCEVVKQKLNGIYLRLKILELRAVGLFHLMSLLVRRSGQSF